MYYTGFADEAARDIDGQIRATKELGWENIESRNIDGKNIHDMPDEDFDVVYGKLQDAGVKINCFGSAIANWAKSVEDPIDASLAETERAIPRMKKLGTELVRIMSFAQLKDRAPDDQMEEERFSRLRRIVNRLLEEGITPVHENCMNYGGMSWEHTLKLLENVPGLKLVFDTGNPIFNNDFRLNGNIKQDAWEFYKNVKDHIAYIHIKDGKFQNGDMLYTLPGEGDGYVEAILTDLLANAYNGGISIEPHLGVVFHDDNQNIDQDYCYKAYIEYGRALEVIITNITLPSS